MMKNFLLCILALITLGFPLAAQQPGAGQAYITLGRVDTLPSRSLDQTRQLNIYLPPGYSPDSATTYPVIYLLDGSVDEDFIHICGIVQFLNFPWVNRLPPSIVVGIANRDRRRDFTYPSRYKEDLQACPTSGGSARFISFIREELKPYIRQHYRTNSQATLVGESLGGLLALEILLKDPGLFNNYLIVSPSLWWDHESLIDYAQKHLGQAASGGRKVYLSAGSEGRRMQQDMNRLFALLKKQPSSRVQAWYVPFPGENHATIMHLSAYKGFELLNHL